MKATVIACAACGGRWKVSPFDPLYLQLELSMRPCPHCEAYTLSCQEARDSAPLARPGQAERQRLRTGLIQPAPG